MIDVKNISFHRHRKPILDHVSVSIAKGELTALVGPNGAGKSTLLSLIARLLHPSDGAIAIDGQVVSSMRPQEMAKLLAFMRQDTAVTSRLRVRELVGFGRFPHHRGKPTAEDHTEVLEALSLFDLIELADRYLDTLSGGQRQRALVAMAYAQGTDYLLLDEPLNNLDIFYARELMQQLRALVDERGRTIVIVLHDINQAAAYADRIVAMKDGQVLGCGSPDEIVTTENLQAIFGFEMPVAVYGSKPVALHFQ